MPECSTDLMRRPIQILEAELRFEKTIFQGIPIQMRIVISKWPVVFEIRRNSGTANEIAEILTSKSLISIELIS